MNSELESLHKNYNWMIQNSKDHVEKIKSVQLLLKGKPNKIEKFNFSLFFALGNLDIVMVSKYLKLSLLSGNQLESNYFARIAAMQIYEHIKDVKSLSGLKVRKELPKSESEIINEFDQLNKKFSNIKKKYEIELKEIRNKSIAHKNKDGFHQAEFISEIDAVRISAICSEVLMLNIDFISFSSKALAYI